MGVRDSLLGKLLGSADKFSDEQVLQTISMLVEHGVSHNATDIHIEPQERYVLVRYRIGGVLKGVYKLPLGALPAAISQIKTLAHLNPQETDTPQEGQYATLAAGQELELLVSTLPVVGGEKAVLHITRHLAQPPTLETLGYWGANLTDLREVLAHTHGLVLVAAPRRNGKATTMHSMLQLLNTPSMGLATVESAIEYRLPGASQVRVRPHMGITFFKGLQATLNQDPNILLVGSIPDRQTADLVSQAASSGHFIIGGLYADSASSALSHLTKLTSEPLLLASAAQAVVSQRLVRRLCQHCRERAIPGEQQLAELEEAFGIRSAQARRRVHELEQQAAQAGLDTNKHVNTTPGHIVGLWRASEGGCEHCDHSGYTGAIAITEVLPITEAVRQLILQRSGAAAIHSQVLKDGFIPMGLDGLVKALRGVTTVTEVLRVL